MSYNWNCLAKVVTRSPRFSYAMPLLKSLYCLIIDASVIVYFYDLIHFMYVLCERARACMFIGSTITSIRNIIL